MPKILFALFTHRALVPRSVGGVESLFFRVSEDAFKSPACGQERTFNYIYLPFKIANHIIKNTLTYL